MNSIGNLHKYEHARWENNRRILRFLIQIIGTTFLLRLDEVHGLENVPTQGATILFFNHTALVDPITIIHLVQRNIIPLAKVEVYEYPIIGIFPKLWGVIPVRREEFDRLAIRQALSVLQAGEMLLIAPEGTRNPQMQTAKDGLAYLAYRTNTPLVPVAINGTTGYPTIRGSRRWRQGGVKVKFGQPFRFRRQSTSPKREQLNQMTNEAMYALATLLPEQNRGVYADLSQATQENIEWVTT